MWNRLLPILRFSFFFFFFLSLWRMWDEQQKWVAGGTTDKIYNFSIVSNIIRQRRPVYITQFIFLSTSYSTSLFCKLKIMLLQCELWHLSLFILFFLIFYLLQHSTPSHLLFLYMHIVLCYRVILLVLSIVSIFSCIVSFSLCGNKRSSVFLEIDSKRYTLTNALS